MQEVINKKKIEKFIVLKKLFKENFLKKLIPKVKKIVIAPEEFVYF
jgi:hypothetical protein